MNSTGFIPILLLLLILLWTQRNERMALVKIIQKRKRKDGTSMKELAKQFIGKDVLIYSFNSQQLDGVVKEVTDGALLLEKDGTLEAINLDFIVRIREFPKKKNGKKKSVVLD